VAMAVTEAAAAATSLTGGGPFSWQVISLDRTKMQRMTKMMVKASLWSQFLSFLIASLPPQVVFMIFSVVSVLVALLPLWAFLFFLVVI